MKTKTILNLILLSYKVLFVSAIVIGVILQMIK